MRVKFLTWAPALLLLGLSAWHWHQLRGERAVLVAAARAASLNPAAKEGPSSTVEGTAKTRASNPPSAELSALLREIHEEETALAQMTRHADDLAARLPAADDDELIASFGRIEDMGRDTGAALQGLIRMLAGENASGTEDEANFMRLMRVKGRLPEIRNFEDNPDEIARFQSSTLRQALGLSEAAESAMRPLIRDAFTEMAAQNLTATQMPPMPDEAKEWINRRSQALQHLMRQLRPHLPDSEAAATRAALMFALNVGAGLDQRQSLAPGPATLTIGVTWPKVPW